MKFSKLSRLLFLSFYLIFIHEARAQFIKVDKSLSAQQLVDRFIGAQNASCINVSKISVKGENFSGTDLSYGYFDRNGSSFDIDEGIILSTGKISLAPGPNDNLQSEYVSGWNSDQDLFDILTQSGAPTDNLRNATYLEFDFESLQSDKISFDYMFLSEEYRPSNCQYSDAFAFLIKKADNSEPYKNIALVPGTNIPVTSTTINGANCNGQDGHPQFFGMFNPETSNSLSPTNFNGQTKVLKAVTTVEKGVKYHIKLVIADHGDARGLYDSAVFLKSGSFTGNINIGNDLTLGNENALCKDTNYKIQPVPTINDPSAKYLWFKDGQPIAVPDTQSYYDVYNDEGDFSLKVTLGSGCNLEGNVKIEKAPVAVIDNTPIFICDTDFDGSYKEKLSQYSGQIVRNYSRDFTVSYAASPTGAAIDPNAEFTFTQNPQTLYVRVGAFACTPDLYPIQFFHGSKLKIDKTNPTFNVCDSDRSGSEVADLSKYVGAMTTETGITPKFYNSEPEAEKGGVSTADISQTFDAVNSSKTFYLRIESASACPDYASFKLEFKQPLASTSLKDTVICKNTTIDLVAGPGFDDYEWSNGVKGPFADRITNVGPDDYWVKLSSNGCVFQQFLKIAEAEEPVIDNVLIEGTTATVLVSGGTKPYSFALDNGAYQSSSVFTNVELGTHIVYVKGYDACSVVSKEFTLINTQNVITPNHDGINDFIDYSSLMTKLEPKFEIYDRFGNPIFKGENSNQFIWNGTASGRLLPTGTYWYILEWNEAGNPARTKLSGWILLKDRN